MNDVGERSSETLLPRNVIRNSTRRFHRNRAAKTMPKPFSQTRCARPGDFTLAGMKLTHGARARARNALTHTRTRNVTI